MEPGDPAQVLVVGAGPTGLALAAQLTAFGVRVRLVDRAADRVHESRALAIQPRTLEVLAGLGVTERLVAAGNRMVRLVLHVRGRALSLPMFDFGLADTAYPYLLFLSQAETERILTEHLAAAGVVVERQVELTALTQDGDGVSCELSHGDGRAEVVAARYVVGCDGAHSSVRRLAGIGFEGGTYPQTFVLADVDADGIEPGAAHVFIGDRGPLFFFPLGSPATWRLLAIRPPAEVDDGRPVDLPAVQDLADEYTGGGVRLRDPVWMTDFRIHLRAATAYRSGRAFLAGDAAHIHSPAGAQGMNTGIQDAVNLAWKLAHTLRGATPRLLDTYETERLPVGRTVLRFTDRAFTAATSTTPLVRAARARVPALLVPLAARAKRARAFVFRNAAQLGIRYRNSPLSTDNARSWRRGPRPGDRLPDTAVLHNGERTTLHAAVAAPAWHLIVCGASPPPAALVELTGRYEGCWSCTGSPPNPTRASCTTRAGRPCAASA
ncbi:FAD-dependent monooxygenase [Phytohabitans houttuyneae]|uniref:FAD-binding domain-containing protein n=1 Tax=Phytohabitans houttuyneae TaxID=1076126 RepID=A0A6V8KHH2_9ACTN|nr:FAD-dependent monooxygenase [Phytohabitans houttuyneae]GFJ81446.1 hypothetical protein Phou_056260 [Phytohabitans houttuyneae]